MSVEFLIGADPELFVRDRDGNLVSAFGMIPGTKESPHEVEGGAVQVDGMALEFNINPANNFKDFNKNITSVLAQLKEMIPNGYTFDFSPVAEFGKEYIDKQPDMAKELGCNPDFNAHRNGPNEKPSADYPFRTASGHIHIGWTAGQDIDIPEHIEACRMAVSQLDATIGLAARRWDWDKKRSSMYGKFGCYRPKPYGVEYRTLSNTWVGFEDRREAVFSISMEAMEKLLTGKRLYEKWFIPDFDIYVDRGEWATLVYWAQKNMAGFKGLKNWQRIGPQEIVNEPRKSRSLDDIIGNVGWNNAIHDAFIAGQPAPIPVAIGNNAVLVDMEIEEDFEPFEGFVEDGE
jgi:hypothetical protein